MQIPPSAKEIKAAVTKKGCDAIPYADLRDTGKKAYAKQKNECQNCTCNGLTEANEIQAAATRAQLCREHRVAVRTIFAQAIGRVKGVIQGMKSGDPLKPDMEHILKELLASQKGHEIAIDDVNKAYLNCEEKLKKLK